MIRMIQSTSERHAKSYFSDSLSKSDYYVNDQELQGRFYGRLAERLQIAGPADRRVFFALCENKHPHTGEQLTPRTKQKRTIGYDINFHAPKSLSILHALAKDDHLLQAFEQSVHETMLDIEAQSKTRVRKNDVYEDRLTGELAWAHFTHLTARPVDDHLPDPHVHTHAYIFNGTWDEQEKKFKAAKFFDIKRDMPYYQACFHKRLADKLAALGYDIRRSGNSFEIDHVSQKMIEHFSKRTKEIERIAKKKNITDAKEKDALGARTRSKKQKSVPMEELKTHWHSEIVKLHESGVETYVPVRHPPVKQKTIVSPLNCINYALQHHFERASVVSKKQLLQTAYQHSFGIAEISLDAITDAFEKHTDIIHIEEGGKSLCTTKEVLSEERRMVELARQGQGKMSPLYFLPATFDNSFDEYQKAAMNHILTTSDRVSIIRGVAGAGKTTLMKEAIGRINNAMMRVMVVAPSAQDAREELKREGYKDADTVAKLLVDKKMQDKLEGQVLWVNEAGLLGTRDTLKLLQLVTKKNARLILSGDTRQHASVVRGDALRILNTVGGIKAAEVSKIYRQRRYIYKEAVKDLSEGKIENAFGRLTRMGAIKTIDPDIPYKQLVEDYISVLKNKKTALVISPTHKEGEAVTQEIRARMRELNMIGKRELTAIKYESLKFTEAEKRDIRNYQPGQFIQFNQNRRGIVRGSLWRVMVASDDKVYIQSTTDKNIITEHPRHEAGSYDIFEQKTIGLSKGDKVRITRAGFDAQEKPKRLDNGMTLEVTSVSSKGKIILRNPISKNIYKLPQDYGHLTQAHCITSQASQGKTVDEVFIAQPSSTFGATDAKQFYVSVSRGRDSAHIYTDDKEALLEHVSELGNRQSALELIIIDKTHVDHVLNQQRRDHVPEIEPHHKDNVSRLDKLLTYDDYEP